MIGPRRRWLDIVLLALAALAAAAGLAALLPRELPFDDAYITLQAADRLAHGGGDPSWRQAAALEGVTSAPHATLVALAGLLLAAPRSAHLVAALALLALVLGLWRLARSLGTSPAWAAALTLATILAGELLPLQIFNGLETGLAAAAVAWALAWAAAPEPPRRALAILCGALPYLRPDLAGLALALLGLDAWRRAQREAQPLWRGAASSLLLAALGATPWALLYVLQTGAPLPQSGAVKTWFYAGGSLPAAVKARMVYDNLVFFAPGLFTLGAAFLLLRRVGRAALIGLAAFLGGAFVLFPQAVGLQQARYLHAYLPAIACGWALALAAPAQWLRRLAQAALPVAILLAAWHLPETVRLYRANCAFTRRELAPLAAWMRRQPEDLSPVLVHDAGYLAWATRLEMVDLVGLKTPSAARLHHELTWRSCGAGRAAAVDAIARAAGVRSFVVLRSWDTEYRLSDGLRRAGWELEPLRASAAGYDVYRLTPPAAAASAIPSDRAAQGSWSSSSPK